MVLNVQQRGVKDGSSSSMAFFVSNPNQTAQKTVQIEVDITGAELYLNRSVNSWKVSTCSLPIATIIDWNTGYNRYVVS